MSGLQSALEGVIADIPLRPLMVIGGAAAAAAAVYWRFKRRDAAPEEGMNI